MILKKTTCRLVYVDAAAANVRVLNSSHLIVRAFVGGEA